MRACVRVVGCVLCVRVCVCVCVVCVLACVRASMRCVVCVGGAPISLTPTSTPFSAPYPLYQTAHTGNLLASPSWSNSLFCGEKGRLLVL